MNQALNIKYVYNLIKYGNMTNIVQNTVSMTWLKKWLINTVYNYFLYLSKYSINCFIKFLIPFSKSI